MSAGLTSETQPGASPEERLRWRKALRQLSVERRLALSADQCAEFSEKICQHLRDHFPQLAGMRVGFCWPVNNEPDLRPLMRAWIASGNPEFAALLPVVQGHAMPLAFRAWTPECPILADRFGIPTPSTGPFIQPQAVLIPVNAFDAAGYRIGYGGGFFDRTLASIKPTPLSIGVGFDLSRVDSVRPEAHDVRLDAMVTESGVFSSSPLPQG
ncbi:MAG: 5-formyltetrahydrofolate cyclo-ligase [Betaproteobacteria bacterium]